jgi:hypothetical protein
VRAARDLAALLRSPERTAAILSADRWQAALTAGRAEQLLGSLAERLAPVPVPPEVDRVLGPARAAAAHGRLRTLWEAEMARRALAPAGIAFVLLKGSAYAAARLDAAAGRSIGDLDILVARDDLDAAEQALLAAGWEWVKPDPYDDAYYRRWMHELPPLIHRERDRMIDVHHTILPLTARPRPQPALLLADAVPLGDGLAVLSPADMIVHAAAHLIADGDLAGGLRNLWDIDRLFRQFSATGNFPVELHERARQHDLAPAVARALRLADRLYGTPVDARLAGRPRLSDRLFIRRLLARDGWGRARRPLTRLAFYIRSHWLRMPPAMLARHLWVKWRRG